MDRKGFLRFLIQRRTIFIVLFLLAWLVFIDLLWLLPTQNSIRVSASELSTQIAENASSNVSAYLTDILLRVQNASLDIQAEPDRTQKILERILERNPAFINVALVDDNGTVLMRAGRFTTDDDAREFITMLAEQLPAELILRGSCAPPHETHSQAPLAETPPLVAT